VSGFRSGGPFLFLSAGCGERGWRGRERSEARRGKCKCACSKGQCESAGGRSRMTGERLLYADEDEGIYLKQKVPQR
jgi:hypothetical protein